MKTQTGLIAIGTITTAMEKLIVITQTSTAGSNATRLHLGNVVPSILNITIATGGMKAVRTHGGTTATGMEKNVTR